MASSVDVLRAELTQRRTRLARLQQEETVASTEIDEWERAIARRRQEREQISLGIRHETEAIAALDRALAVLAEAMPVESSPSPPHQEAPARAVLPSNPTALRILQEAEEIDLGKISERTRSRAEAVRAILLAYEGSVQQEEIIAAMSARESTQQKAETAVRVGLALLVAERRARCARAAEEYWELTPPERASASLGAQLHNFEGRTTRWPKESTRPPQRGTRIVVEEGSYEGGKR